MSKYKVEMYTQSLLVHNVLVYKYNVHCAAGC